MGVCRFWVVVVVSFVVLFVGWGGVTVWLGLVVLGRYVWVASVRVYFGCDLVI